MKPEILTLDDVKLLVDSFYERVQKDDLLSPVFNNTIQNRWPVHLEKMYRFWQTVLLGEHTYQGSPFLPHAKLPIDETHFNRWLQLFIENIHDHFSGEKADEAIWRAQKMAEMFQFKLSYYKQNTSTPLL